MKEVIVVFLGGGLGSVSRYLVGVMALSYFPQLRFPLGTFIVNCLGCFLIGLVITVLQTKFANPDLYRLLLVTGFLGGFTTFSAFGYEVVYLLRSSDLSLALLYSLSSLILGGICAYLGILSVKSLT